MKKYTTVIGQVVQAPTSGAGAEHGCICFVGGMEFQAFKYVSFTLSELSSQSDNTL